MAAALVPRHLLRARLELSPLHSSFDIILVIVVLVQYYWPHLTQGKQRLRQVQSLV